jgi:hypothetical protein
VALSESSQVLCNDAPKQLSLQTRKADVHKHHVCALQHQLWRQLVKHDHHSMQHDSLRTAAIARMFKLHASCRLQQESPCSRQHTQSLSLCTAEMHTPMLHVQLTARKLIMSRQLLVRLAQETEGDRSSPAASGTPTQSMTADSCSMRHIMRHDSMRTLSTAQSSGCMPQVDFKTRLPCSTQHTQAPHAEQQTNPERDQEQLIPPAWHSMRNRQQRQVHHQPSSVYTCGPCFLIS